MTDIPETPIVPPAPSRLNLGSDFAEKADALAAFYPTLVAYIAAAIAWIVDAMQQIAATALAGTLPSLSGHALKFMRVNAAGTMAEFVAPTAMMSGTALEGLTSAHSSVGFLVTTSNLALGAADVLNTTLWPASQVGGGVTATITARGYRSDGTPYVRVALTGTTPSPNGTGVAYFTNSGRIAAAVGTYTASAVITKISGVAAGAGMRVSLVEEIAPSTTVGNTTGNAVNTVGSTITSAATRTTTTGNQLRPALQWVYPTGTVLNEVFDIDGLQLEVGSARTPGVFREAIASEAFMLMAQRGARLGYADGEYTAQNSVTSEIPQDSTAPLWSEGAHLISVDYVPKRIGSKLLVNATLPLIGMSAAASAIAVLYINEVAVRIGVFTAPGAGYEGGITIRHALTLASLNSVKVSLRFGPQATGYTAFINRGSAGHTFGGAVSTLLTVEEVAQ